MSAPDDGGPAFPETEYGFFGILFPDTKPGLTRRQFYAGQIAGHLSALVSHHAGSGFAPKGIVWSPEQVASHSFAIADAMIAAEKKTSNANPTD